MQQYAGVYLLQNYSTYFGCLSHPSSGVHQTVTAAPATGRSVRATTFRQRGLIRPRCHVRKAINYILLCGPEMTALLEGTSTEMRIWVLKWCVGAHIYCKYVDSPIARNTRLMWSRGLLWNIVVRLFVNALHQSSKIFLKSRDMCLTMSYIRKNSSSACTWSVLRQGGVCYVFLLGCLLSVHS